jgi:hypothetical protein
MELIRGLGWAGQLLKKSIGQMIDKVTDRYDEGFLSVRY